ncbi:FAD binding domain protein [Aspergillus bombycis]|uniref:FAD binding domain protein n=1 Tax=Aspergillus bombycis TaxID=109264 RepID=A0A1F7ZY90_9EURO|nr:FAD binding domain protein [Aspergillus bombycis]OGM44436.1 FAD binding domain protein [Aspergillus bombycis]
MLHLFALVLAACQLSTALECKCSPSEPCWPSDADWASLDETISGHLIRTVPLAAVCYQTESVYNAEACNAVLANWTSSAFHSADPASIDDPMWANNSCNPIYPNGTSLTGNTRAGEKGCSIGSYPPYVVNATESGHVKAALKFARRWNLRLNIKNTGHGSERSTAHGSLSIWTHNLKQIQFHETFQPQSCATQIGVNETQMAVTLGAGVQDGELFKAMSKHDAIAVGGTNADVGVVGWATGGGHGLATGNYGMGADNIIEAVIVTPGGEVAMANACQNEDLFWAIRGGGGGTFGVILSVTLKAYPMPSVTLIDLSMTAKNGTRSSSWYRFVARAHGYLDLLQEAGVHGYYTMGGDSLALQGALLLYDATNGTVDELLAPMRRFFAASNATATSNLTPVATLPWYDLVKMMPAIESVGTKQSARASRFIPQRVVRDDIELFAETLEAISSGPVNDGVSTPSISGTMTGSRTPVDNALNPAWRDAVVHIITSQSWDESLPPPVADQVVHNMTYQKGYALRQLAPDTGAYFNEANANEPNWQWSFFGSGYARLQAIKQKYDPEGLLWCRHCVGSEGWTEQEDGRLCRAF